jgi:hypothetical protein
MSTRPLLARGPGTRLARRDAPAQRLEALGAEFALLAQRRARVARQLTLLDTQRDAALHDLAALEHRMAQLARRMTLGPVVEAPPHAGTTNADPLPTEPAQTETTPPAARRGRRVLHQY